MQTHAFAHDSFALNRQVDARAQAMSGSGAPDWPSYAKPLLAMATQSRAVHVAQGRALVLERFLAHMRTDPGVAATEAWFVGEIAEVGSAADEAGSETGQMARSLEEPLIMDEERVRAVVAAAAREGRVRGEALQLGDLRRAAANYYRRLGYDEGSLAFDRGDASAAVADDRLVADVESRLGWTRLRQAILAARTCKRTEAAVTCTPRPAGSVPEESGEEQPVAPPPPERSILPGDTIRSWEPKVRAPDLLDRRPGW